MELNEYQKKAMSTCMESSHNYVYMAEGLVGETGEFMSKITKAIRKGQISVIENRLIISNEFKSELMKGLKGELGDILWFVAGLADVLGYVLDDVAEDNLNKLASRKDRNVIVGDGDYR